MRTSKPCAASVVPRKASPDMSHKHAPFIFVLGVSFLFSINDRPGEHHRAVPQQAGMGSQPQRIEESIGSSTNGQASVVGADKPSGGLVDDDLLLGIGSQFDSGSDPAPLTTKHGHRSHQ